MQADSLQVRLVNASVGTAFVMPLEMGQQRELAWFVKEDEAWIASLGENPQIDFRCGAFQESVGGQKVVPVVILLRLGPETSDSIFEAWIDACESDELSLLAEQDQLTIHLYDSQCRTCRVLAVDHPLREFAAATLEHLTTIPRWQPHQFHSARKRIYEQFEDAYSLWHGLE